jgi:hypothetical protein
MLTKPFDIPEVIVDIPVSVPAGTNFLRHHFVQ